MNNVNVTEIDNSISSIGKDSLQDKKHKAITGHSGFEDGKPRFISPVEYREGKVTLNTGLPPFTGGWGTSPDLIQYCLYGLAVRNAQQFSASRRSAWMI